MKVAFGVALGLALSVGIFAQEKPQEQPNPPAATHHKVIPPKVMSAPDPDYTPEDLKKAKGGGVVLLVGIGEDGKVTDVKVARSVDPEVDRKAIEAVKRWKFKPAKRDGKPIATQINIDMMPRLTTLGWQDR